MTSLGGTRRSALPVAVAVRTSDAQQTKILQKFHLTLRDVRLRGCIVCSQTVKFPRLMIMIFFTPLKNCSYFIRESSLRCLPSAPNWGFISSCGAVLFLVSSPSSRRRRRRDVRGAPKVDDVVLRSSITAAAPRSSAAAAKVDNFANSFVVKNGGKERENKTSAISSRRSNRVYCSSDEQSWD